MIGLPGAGNVISPGNNYDAIVAYGASGTVIQDNKIGTTADGMELLPGQGLGAGISLTNCPDTLIGGTAPGTGNVIALGPWSSGYTVDTGFVGGFPWIVDGIDILSYYANGMACAGTVIEGNLIGTDAAGDVALGNSNFGIALINSSDITIGGTAAGAGNVIAGNSEGGIALLGGTIADTGPASNTDYGSSDDSIEGNLIGINFDSSGNPIAGLGNGGPVYPVSSQEAGIYISDPTDPDQTSSANTIGGTVAGAANVIADNVGLGIAIVGGSAVGDPILGNQIYGNTALGIDLGDDGVTLDHSSPTTGIIAGAPNGLQNFPVLGSAVFVPDASDPKGTLTVDGTLAADPDSAYLVQVFADSTADPSGYGQGQTVIASFDVITDGSGAAVFSDTFATGDLAGELISATATDPSGNTSEFSQDLSVISSSASTVSVPIVADPATEESLVQSAVSEIENLPVGTTLPSVGSRADG